MKRAQKKFERDPRKKIFFEQNPTRGRKHKITNKVRDLKTLQCHLSSHCKSRTLCHQMYWKVHLVTPIAKVHLVRLNAKLHLVTPSARLFIGQKRFLQLHAYRTHVVSMWSKSGVNRLIGSKDIEKTSTLIKLTYIFLLVKSVFNQLKDVRKIVICK